MSVNTLSVGVDFNFGMYDANTGATLDMGDIQSIKETANKHDIVSRPYNAPPKYGYVPDGYGGTFTIVRTGSQMEDLQIRLSNQFNSGAPVKAGYLNKIVTDQSGVVKKYIYTGVTFFMTDIGDISREKTITQTVTWMASDKQPLA